MRSCGIEINPTSVRYVVLDRGRRGTRAVCNGRVPVDADQSPIHVLTQLRNSGEIPHRIRVATGLEKSQLKSLILPPMPQDELEKAVQHEISRELEMVDEEMAVGYQVLGREPGGKRRILVAQTPKRSVQGLELELHEAGFEVEALTTSSVALLSYGLTELDLSKEQQAIAVVHIGQQRMLLTVLERGRIRLMRDLGLGLDISLFGSLSLGATGTTGAAAPALDGDDIDWELLDSLSRGLSEVNQVAGQIRRTLEYDASESPDLPVARMLLAGDVTRAEAMVPLISNEISLPIELLDPTDELGLQDDTEFGGEGPSYALPFALAKPRRADAFLHLGQRPRAKTKDLRGAASSLALGFGALATIVSMQFGEDIRQLTEARESLYDDVASLEEQLGAKGQGLSFAGQSASMRSILENAYPLEAWVWTASRVPHQESIESLVLERVGSVWSARLEGTFRSRPLPTGELDWSRFQQMLEQEPRVRDLTVLPVDGASSGSGIPLSVTFTWDGQPQ